MCERYLPTATPAEKIVITAVAAPIILDEPTKFVSKGNAKDVALFLSETSKNMNKQIIMVTHDGISKEFADKTYEISLDKDGISNYREVSKTSD